MPRDACSCCGGGTEQHENDGMATDRSPAASSVLDAELPPELRTTLGRFVGLESVDTLDEWAAIVRQHVPGNAISFDELCVTDEETAHRGTVDGTSYHFACFYDAVILAALTDRPVDIRTASPIGSVIEARAIGTDGLSVTPETAVFSFGIEADVEPPSDDGPRLERGYAAICPYVRAFPSRDDYERWAETVPAATIAMPLSGATELAAKLVD